jgi:hypothetical protein
VIQHQNKGRFAQRLAKFQHTHLTETRLDTEIRLCLQGNRARVCRPRGAYGMLVTAILNLDAFQTPDDTEVVPPSPSVWAWFLQIAIAIAIGIGIDFHLSQLKTQNF